MIFVNSKSMKFFNEPASSFDQKIDRHSLVSVVLPGDNCKWAILNKQSIYQLNVKNVTEEYLTSFAVKRDIFHAFFRTLNDPEINIEYDHCRLVLSNLETEETSTSQIDFSQSAGLGITQTSQFMPIIYREEISIEISVTNSSPFDVRNADHPAANIDHVSCISRRNKCYNATSRFRITDNTSIIFTNR